MAHPGKSRLVRREGLGLCGPRHTGVTTFYDPPVDGEGSVDALWRLEFEAIMSAMAVSGVDDAS